MADIIADDYNTDPIKDFAHSEIYNSDKYKVWIMNGFIFCYKKAKDQFDNEYWSNMELSEYSFLIEELIKKVTVKEKDKVVVNETVSEQADVS